MRVPAPPSLCAATPGVIVLLLKAGHGDAHRILSACAPFGVKTVSQSRDRVLLQLLGNPLELEEFVARFPPAAFELICRSYSIADRPPDRDRTTIDFPAMPQKE